MNVKSVSTDTLMKSLVVITIADLIKGFFTDVFSPLIDALLPGTLTEPVNLFGIKLYINRFLIRVINFVFAFLLARYLISAHYW